MTIHTKKLDKIKELIKLSSIWEYNCNYLKILIGTDDKLPIGEELSLKKSLYCLEKVLKVETYIILKYY